MEVAPHCYRSNALDRAAYMRGRDDARAGLERFPRCQHPDQYGAYNAGFYDWHKLQAFSAMLAALKGAHQYLLDYKKCDNHGLLRDMAAAIAKAEGRV